MEAQSSPVSQELTMAEAVDRRLGMSAPEEESPPSDLESSLEDTEVSPEEAAIIAKWMNLKVVIPHHYPPGSEEPKLLAEYARRESPETKVVILKAGESFSYDHDKVFAQNQDRLMSMNCFIKYGNYTNTNKLTNWAK